jgi:hypothetical protein
MNDTPEAVCGRCRWVTSGDAHPFAVSSLFQVRALTKTERFTMTDQRHGMFAEGQAETTLVGPHAVPFRRHIRGNGVAQVRLHVLVFEKGTEFQDALPFPAPNGSSAVGSVCRVNTLCPPACGPTARP